VAKKSLRTYVAVGVTHGLGGVLPGFAGASKVAHAVPDLGGEFGLVEVVDPLRVLVRMLPLEDLRCAGEGTVAAGRIAEAGQSAGLLGMEQGGQRGRGLRSGAGARRARKVGGLVVVAEEGCLVAHGGKDASTEPAVVAGLGESERL